MSFDEDDLLQTFVLYESTLPPPPSSNDENTSHDVVEIDSKKEEPKPKKPRTRTREIKAKPDSSEKIPTAKEMKERYEAIKHKSSSTKAQLPPPPAVEENDDKKTVLMKKAISALKKKVENIETKCADIDFLMTQTSHLLSDYEGFNNDVEDANESIKTIEDQIKMQEETIKDLCEWKKKQMQKDCSKTKEDRLNEFQGGIVLLKDKILHLKKLTLMTEDNAQKQHLCEHHLPIIYRMFSSYGHEWTEFYDKNIKNENDFNTVIDKLLKITNELMKKFIGKTISIPKFKF